MQAAKQADKKNTCLKLLECSYISLLCGIFLVFFLSFTGFLFHISVQSCYIPVSVILGTAMFIILAKRNEISRYETFKALFLLYVFVTAFGFVSLLITDTSWDGRWYHQSGIFLLKNGFNPVFDNDILNLGSVHKSAFASSIMWVKGYPKFAEIFGANIYVLCGKIEAAKIINFLGMYLCFVYSFLTFNNIKKCKFNLLFGVLIVFNPVTICQNATFYVDGLLYYFLICSLFSIINIELSGGKFSKNVNLHILSLVLCACILANIKMSGLLYVLIILAIWFTGIIVRKKRQDVLKVFFTVFLVSGFLIVLSGVNPYFVNIKEGKHIFYPVAGNETANIFDVPAVIRDKNIYSRFLFSTFSTSSHIKTPVLKIPFSINSSDEVFKRADMQFGGFGYFWSGIVLLSMVLLFSLRFNNRRAKNIFLLLMAELLALFLFIPSSWWARYVPWLWAAPVFVCVFSVYENNFRKLAFVVLTAMFLNSSIIFCQNFAQTIHTGYIMNNYILKTDRTKPLKLYQDEENQTTDVAYFIKFAENNIKYEFVSKDEFENGCFEPVIKNLDKKLYAKCR